MKRFVGVFFFLVSAAFYAAADDLSDQLQWLAVQTACIGQYNMAQAGDYTLGDPHDYYKPSDIREYLTQASGDRTKTTTFYGICFDYAQAAYDDIVQYFEHYKNIGVREYYIAAVKDNARQIILYDPVSREKSTEKLNGVYIKENSRKNVQAHGNSTWHAWLWVYGSDGTVYWIDPTWTDNSGYVWWGTVQNGEEVQGRPRDNLCMVTVSTNDEVFALLSRAQANKNQSKYDVAIADYTAALRRDKKNATAYYERGCAYSAKDDYKRAIKDFNAAIKINPNYAYAFRERGIAYWVGGAESDDKQALADLTHAINLDPDVAVFYGRRAGYYNMKGYYDKSYYRLAAADYNQAIRLNPTDWRYYWSLSTMYRRMGDEDMAIATDNAAINLHTDAINRDPYNASSYFARAQAYESKKDYDRAIADYTQAITLDPSTYEFSYRVLGDIYAKKGDYDRAIANYLQAIQLNHGTVYTYTGLGDAYIEKGDYDYAIAAYNAALQIDSDNFMAKRGLEKAKRRG